MHSVVKIHSCECGYSTSDKSNFNKHKKRCSQTNQPLPTAQAGPSTSTPLKPPPQAVAMNRPTHVCDQCGKHYRSKFGMQLHIKNKHSKDFKYKGTLCDKKFNQQRPYRYHCAKHLNVSIDKCHHCKKEFNSPGSLSRHLVVCTGTAQTKKFKCDLCAASFPHKYRLKYPTSDTIVVSDGTHHERDLPSRPCSNLGHPSRD